MGNGQWGLEKELLPMSNDGRCFKPGNPSNALPPQCPMPDAQCPIPNSLYTIYKT
ncbi:hypothetical protein [Tolypothrix sp. VBCCA 56010]|uniref:hypothetical protein n=1 Tax=Tolypothrix sp. VBCCA 56010 TaxID=3137731 RepID=UPI003D7D7EC5